MVSSPLSTRHRKLLAVAACPFGSASAPAPAATLPLDAAACHIATCDATVSFSIPSKLLSCCRAHLNFHFQSLFSLSAGNSTNKASHPPESGLSRAILMATRLQSSQTMCLSICDELSGVKLTSRGYFLFHLKLTSHQFWEIVWIA